MKNLIDQKIFFIKNLNTEEVLLILNTLGDFSSGSVRLSSEKLMEEFGFSKNKIDIIFYKIKGFYTAQKEAQKFYEEWNVLEDVNDPGLYENEAKIIAKLLDNIFKFHVDAMLGFENNKIKEIVSSIKEKMAQ